MTPRLLSIESSASASPGASANLVNFRCLQWLHRSAQVCTVSRLFLQSTPQVFTDLCSKKTKFSDEPENNTSYSVSTSSRILIIDDHLMYMKPESRNEILDVGHEPHGMGDNPSPTLHMRMLRAIKHEDWGKWDLEKLAELEEKCLKLRIFSRLHVEALLLKSSSAVVDPNSAPWSWVFPPYAINLTHPTSMPTFKVDLPYSGWKLSLVKKSDRNWCFSAGSRIWSNVIKPHSGIKRELTYFP